jgi:hypothetical protein
MSKIRESRVKQFHDMERRWGCDSGNVAMVFSRDGKAVGYAEDFGSSYTGEAGFSSRLMVIWNDGSMTLCCVKGMRSWMPHDYAPGGFRKWQIL